VRVVVVAPALAVRAGLRALLEGEDRLQVVVEAASLAEIAYPLPGCDVLVLAGGEFDADELGEVLRSSEPLSVLLLVSGDPAATRALGEFPARAWGVLPMDASAEELSIAVRALAEGLLVGSPALMRSLVTMASGSQSGQEEQLIEALTEREGEVLEYMAQGLANKQIAAALGISEHTVKFHASAIFAKLGAASRTEAVRIGIRRGLVVL
jgi:DNA-binding NarL/FixJ family response regulator